MGIYFLYFITQPGKGSLIFCDSSVLNSILFFKKSEHLNFLDKLEQAKRIYRKWVLKLEQTKLIFEVCLKCVYDISQQDTKGP